MMSFYRSRFDERGATAIEYAIIAGLIGLGLVGSLVTTRGSLSTVFGKAGTQMASADAALGQPAAGSRYAGAVALFQQKTLASTSAETVQSPWKTRTYTFTDGSSAKILYGYASYQGYVDVIFTDPSNNPNVKVEVGNAYRDINSGTDIPQSINIITRNAGGSVVSQLSSMYVDGIVTQDTLYKPPSSNTGSVGRQIDYDPFFADYNWLVALTAGDR